MSLNKVILSGVVAEEPEFLAESIHSEDVLQIKLFINRCDIDRQETISILLFNDDLISKALTLVHKDMYLLMNNGRLITTNYIKTVPIICPHCQNVEYKKTSSEKTEIECLDFSVMECSDPLKAVGINKVFAMGNICSELNYREGTHPSKNYIKYKLAVNRSRREAAETKNADYPFVVSFANEATNAHRLLHTTALVVVEGAIQERTIKQSTDILCENCGHTSSPHVESTVREIITAKVDYVTLGNHESPRQPEDFNLSEISEEN